MNAKNYILSGLTLGLLASCQTVVENPATEASLPAEDWLAAKAEIYRELAVRSLRGGDPDRTRRLLAEAVQFEQGDVRSIQLLARLSLASGELAEAKSYTRWWLQLEPESAPALSLAGIIEESYGNSEEAEAFFKEACRVDSQDPRPLIDLHTFYLNRDRLDEASAVRADVRQRFPNSHEVFLDHGAYLECRGEWDQALVAFQEARVLRPDDLNLAARIGTTALMGNRDDVVGELERELPPHARLEDVSLLLVLAAAHLRDGDEEGVLQELELFEGPAREDPVVSLLRAEILLGRRDLSGAEAAFNDALRQDHRIARAHGGLGRVHLLRGQPDAARRVLQRAVELEPRGAENRALLAACLAQLGDLDRANEHLAVARGSGEVPRLVLEVESRFPQLAVHNPRSRHNSDGSISDDGN